MKKLIKNATVVNEGKTFKANVLIENDVISKIITDNVVDLKVDQIIDASNLFLIPGAIDDQVHFREPGLTHKAEIYTEAKAAVAGGITSYMEMPNTVPNTLTQELLQEKYNRAAEVSLANYSFYMGASNENLKEILKTDSQKVCGVKIFMGSSTGNMLVDNKTALEGIFKECEMLITTHCEDETMIKQKTLAYKAKYGDDIPIQYHPIIRSANACYKSSSTAVELASKYNTRLHVLHISTEKELSLFSNNLPLSEKRITAEACIHHLWFTDADYETKQTLIKWNPAVKTAQDREAIIQAVNKNIIDVIATDHAPHTLQEKQNFYTKAPAGGPLVQHALVAMLEYYHQGIFELEKIVEKMCHHPAILFQIEKRGFIKEGYKADLVLVDLNNPWKVSNDNILYKCKWSPFEGTTFKSKVIKTFINGNLVYDNGNFDETNKGERLSFNR